MTNNQMIKGLTWINHNYKCISLCKNRSEWTRKNVKNYTWQENDLESDTHANKGKPKLTNLNDINMPKLQRPLTRLWSWKRSHKSLYLSILITIFTYQNRIHDRFEQMRGLLIKCILTTNLSNKNYNCKPISRM